MKILTKEEEQAHYNATVKGGITGGLIGLALVRTLKGFKPNCTGTLLCITANTHPPRAEQQSMAHTTASPPFAPSLYP